MQLSTRKYAVFSITDTCSILLYDGGLGLGNLILLKEVEDQPLLVLGIALKTIRAT